MIFYFTGTGNSWYAAQKLKQEGEQVINITECMKQKKYTFEVPAGESLGFVFPVYCWGLPTIVKAFAKRLEITSVDTYTYAVITCGGSIGNAGGMLKDTLSWSNIGLDAVYSLKMPDNYAMMYDTPDEETIKVLLAKADSELLEIETSIRRGVTNRVCGDWKARLITKLVYPFYAKSRKTAPFYADERCVGCGVCASRCPVGAIKMIDGTPTWVKERCVMCLSCARCNAIQYGKKMKKHRRYVNPEYKKVTSCH